MRVQDCSFPVHILMRYRVSSFDRIQMLSSSYPRMCSTFPGCFEILITHNLTEKMVLRTEIK